VRGYQLETPVGLVTVPAPDWDPRITRIYMEYFDLFRARCHDWTLTDFYLAGLAGRSLIEAEYTEHGPDYYRTSLAIAVRNVFYQACRMTERWRILRGMGLREPILEFGCGVGFMLRWFQEHGLHNLAGLEVPGFQRSLVEPYLARHGILMPEALTGRWGTIVCINVLEHLPDPMATLTELRAHTDHVIANCDDHDGPGHDASTRDARQAVIASLRSKGELFP
jgi:methyltransferase family protein